MTAGPDKVGVMNKDTYRKQLERAHALVVVMLSIPAQEMVFMMEQAHAAGPILDPTLYRNNLQGMSEDEDVIRAIRAFQGAIRMSAERHNKTDVINSSDDSAIAAAAIHAQQATMELLYE